MMLQKQIIEIKMSSSNTMPDVAYVLYHIVTFDNAALIATDVISV